MYRLATRRIAFATVLALGTLLLSAGLRAQNTAALNSGPSGDAAGQSLAGGAAVPGDPYKRDWRRVGNSAIDRSLAGLATGPVNRAWYSNSGALLIQTESGSLFGTTDFENWRAVTAAVPQDPPSAGAARLPESIARVRAAPGAPATAYAFGQFVYRSENGGASWDNLTAFRNSSILGGDLRDLAVSPANPDEIVVAGGSGVFRSLDGGKTWSGLNQALPNLPAMRLLTLPEGDRGVRLALAQLSAGGQPLWSAVEWEPGQKLAWHDALDNADLAAELQQRQEYTRLAGTQVTAVATAGSTIYYGTVDGRLMASSDGGASWKPTQLGQAAGAIQRFWIDPADSRTAVAVLGARERDPSSPLPAVHVVHTTNGGEFWDQMTGNLPDVGVQGVTADPSTGALYVATDRGVFMTYTDLRAFGANPQWTPVAGLPAAPVADVKLDAQGNQLWAAVYGYGVYSTLAPHRERDPRVVSTADLVARATSPGSLVSVLGARVQSARAGDLQVPVLTSNDTESQLQIPFEARGDSLSLAVEGPNGRMNLPMQLEAASPGILVERDGSPILLDGDSGVILDAMNAAHSRGRIQILATGLGRVNPDWPTGLAGPLENPPQVVAPVKAYLDRQPVEVTRAELAPFIGYYMIEIEVPAIVNYGPAELYLEAAGKSSNRVRVYIQP